MASSSSTIPPDRDRFSKFLSHPDVPKVRCTSQNARFWYNDWDDASRSLNFEELADLLRAQRWRSDSGVIVIEELDDRAFSLIIENFMNQGLFLFLHEHSARVESAQHPSNRHRTGEVGTFRPQTKKFEVNTGPHGFHGLHFDGFCSSVAAPPDTDTINGLSGGASPRIALTFANDDTHLLSRGYRTETFVSDGSRWLRTSTRISCCMLGMNDLYLVLVDSPLSIHPDNMKNISQGSFPVLPRNPKDKSTPLNWKIFDAFSTLQRVSTNFSIRDVLGFLFQHPLVGPRVDSIFHCLLTISEWQSITEQLERDMRRLRSRATKSVEKTTLDELGGFRRILADTRESIADNELQLRLLTREIALEDVSRQRLQRIHSRSEANDSPEVNNAEAINIPNLLNKLPKLEDRLDAIAQTINDEIQLFIASISIRDSETMIADSKIMKEQAARTTLLTTLAVIYLPLQLITGIFGMNIKEVTGGGPVNWWASLIALIIGGTLTLVVFLCFRWWRQWRDYLQMNRDEQEKKEV